MSKVELQAKVDALDGDIKFFKCLYEGVRLLAHASSVFWKGRCVMSSYLSVNLRAQGTPTFGCWGLWRSKAGVVPH